ncbi:gas vesicle protein GvpL/GvpF [Streptomyces sp. TLI_235]|nr:gas vesicle protein GvpL/GvpF [Streptomyces sp. TLI_235]
MYVCSVVARTHPANLHRLTGVGETAPGLRPERRDLVAHQAVQERLMSDTTGLPMRIGLAVPDDDAVRTALAAEVADALRPFARQDAAHRRHFLNVFFLVLNVFFLVGRNREPGFLRAEEGLFADLGGEVGARLHRPLPPYSFVRGETAVGLLTQILTLPLAPVRGTVWVLERIVETAENEYYDPAPVERELAELESDLLAGRIDEETFDRREDELLDRLDDIRAHWQGEAH